MRNRSSTTAADVAAVTSAPAAKLQYNPYQDAFLKALRLRTDRGDRAFSRLSLFSGRQGGKTCIGALGLCEQVKTPNTIWWACAPTYPKLYDYVIPAIAARLPEAWLAKPFSAQHYEWRLKNGSLIQARSLDDPQRGRGPTLDGLWIDEAREVAPGAYKTLIPTLAVKKGVVLITTTPNGFDYWYEHFWVPAAAGEPGYWACKYRSLDNPAMDKDAVEMSRREMDPLFFQQEWEAEFVSFTGAIYGPSLSEQILDTDAQIRKVLPEWPKIDPGRPCLVGLDPGSDHPFAGIQIVATEAGLVGIGEYEARNESTLGHARALRRMLARDNPASPFEPVTWAIDKSQKQFSIELAQHGIYTTAAPNEVLSGIQRVKSWFLSQRLWIIKSRCPRLIASLYSYRYAENVDRMGAAKKERVVKLNDDLPDALRYALMTWPELPQPAAPSDLRDLSRVADDSRWALDRQQRMDHPDQFEDELDGPGILGSDDPEGGLGEFWS